MLKPSDKAILTATENELCLQWYEPSLEERTVLVPASSAQEEEEEEGAEQREEKQLMLLYAVGKKKEADKHQCGMMWVSIGQLVDLHDRWVVKSTVL